MIRSGFFHFENMFLRGITVLVLTFSTFLGQVQPVTALPESKAQVETFDCANVTEIPQTECEALVALYNSTNGVNWTNSSGWLQTNTPCSWYGISCLGGANVMNISLGNNQLSGSIPAEIGQFALLENLFLGGNPLIGIIPPQLGQLTNLKSLNLGTNQHSGPIPAELGALTHLETLNLSINQLTGTIPSELGNLSALKWLSLGANQLSGGFPTQLTSLHQLENLNLSSDHLSGPIPSEIGSMTSLTLLDLSNNNFSGTIPDTIGSLTSLDHLWLNANQLTGEIPFGITFLTNLSLLSLSCNQLMSTDPVVIAFLDVKSPGWQAAQCFPQNIIARLTLNEVDADGWDAGTLLTLTVEDPLTQLSPDYTATATSQFINLADPDAGTAAVFYFDNSYTLKSGDVVTVEGGGVTRTTTTADIHVTDVDVENDVVSGTAGPGIASVNIRLWSSPIEMRRDADVVNGAWSADFSVASSQYGVYDIKPGDSGVARWFEGDGDFTTDYWYVPNPRIMAHYDNWIGGSDWPLGTTVYVEVDDPANGLGIDFSDSGVVSLSPDGPESTFIEFDLGSFQLAAGQKITMWNSLATSTKTLIVSDLVVSWDLDNDTVSGTTDSTSSIWVTAQCNNMTAGRLVTPVNGSWSADFSIPGTGSSPEEQKVLDLIYGCGGPVHQNDADDDSTTYHWRAGYPPGVVANLSRNQIYSETWPLGSEVTITVDDPSNGTGIDYTDSGVVGETGGGDPIYTWVEFNLFDLILKPNDVVVMSGNSITKELTIAPLEITNVNTDLDLVHGKTTAGLKVAVFARGTDGRWGRRDIVADQYGNWVVDFSTIGPEPDQDIIDITSSSDIDVDLFDADGDYTELSRLIHSPNIGASVKDNSVWGDQWASGSMVTLTIDDPSNGEGVDFQQEQVSGPADWDPNQTYVDFDLGSFQLQPDDLVKMTNGPITKSLLVQYLQVNNVDLDTDVISGLADSDVEVVVHVEGPSGWVHRRAIAAQDGTWSVDFSIPGGADDEQDTVDITYGVNISTQRPDEDSDFTEYGFVPDWIAPSSIPLVFAISAPVDISVPRANPENISVLNALDDSLFRLDNDGNVVPLAAAGYTVSQDGKVYTVTLRADATWSNGDLVTAQQFVDGILRVLDPEVGSDFGYILYPILNAKAFNTGTIINRNLVGIKALNNLTLEFTLEQPTSHFPKILAAPVMLPARQDLINQYGTSWTSPSHFLSNGLYKLAEYDAGHIVLEKNAFYNGPAQATFPQIAFDVIPDPATQVTSYHAGEVDVLLSTSLSTITADSSLKKDLSVMPSPGVQYINFITSVSPINNPLVRKALASAVDRKLLIDNILQTPWRVEATGVIPPELDGYQGSAVGYSYDPAQAQLFLAQAGYEHGAGFPALNFFVVSQNQANVLGEIANQWETVLGITVNIDMVSVAERGTILSNCHASPSTCPYNGYLAGWLIDYPDAYNILNDLFSPDSPYNHLEWDNATYRNLLALAVSEPNSAQRITDLQQAEKILVQDDAAVLPLYYLDSVLVVRPGIYPYYSPMYFSNLAYWSDVDPAGDSMTADVIGSSGGTITTEDNVVSVDVPATALQEEVTLSVTDLGGDYQVTTSQEAMDVLGSFSIQPHGLQFAVPVTLTFNWNDTDDDGLVDVTLQPEENIMLIKDGELITPLPCKDNPNCDMAANTLSVEVTSLSLFELVSPVEQSPVDKTPPVVSSITRVSTSPTSSSSVTFNVVFSEAVTGVNIVPPFNDFTLTTGLVGAAIASVSGSGTNYTVAVNTGSGNGTIRLDVVDDNTIVDEAGNKLGGSTIGDGNFTSGQTYKIMKMSTFGDVPLDYWAWSYIERLSAAGITGGCGGGNYCPTTTVTRDQMAIFLLRGKYGSGYVPPAATGVFQDVPTNYWAATWIEQLAKEGITSGCSINPKLYCPTTPVTRDQMAIFLLRAKYGSNYVPPKAIGVFQDVPTTYWAADWIEQLAKDGITGGCGNNNYCPTTPVTRDQMAIFLVRNFNLP